MSEQEPEAVPGEDLVIHVPAASADATAHQQPHEEEQETGDGVD